MMKRYHHPQFNQGFSAEMLAERWRISRQKLDEFSLRSHQRAALATDADHFRREFVPVRVQTESGVVHPSRDEGIRAATSLEKMATLSAGILPFSPASHSPGFSF